MEILEKVAYMKGLAEGIGLDVKSKEGKLLKVMMDILDDVALELQDIRDEQGDLEDDEDEDEADEEVYQTTCPNCDEEIFFDEDILADGSVLCPNCGEKLEFDLSDLSGCGCCCGACGEDEEDEDEEDEDGEE